MSKKIDVVLIKPSELYNILQQTKFYPCLSDPNYLILLDVRKEADYNESHIITARKPAKDEEGELIVPYGSEIECKKHVIVYDSNTNKLKNETSVFKYALYLWAEGSRYPVKILKGGYELFSGYYPYLRTQKILYTIRELDVMPTYPYEIIRNQLYLGTFDHASLAHIQKEMNISAHICCTETRPPENKRIVSVLHIPKADVNTTELYPHFQEVFDFINNSKTVLIFSRKGISRSVTILLAYLIKQDKYTLKEAYSYVKSCCQFIRPLCAFMRQLSKWEEEILNPKPIIEENENLENSVPDDKESLPMSEADNKDL